MQKLLLITFVFTTMFIASGANAETGLKKRHSKWTSLARYEDSDISFRAYTEIQNSGWKGSLLTFDRYPDEPSMQYVTINAVLNTPNTSTLRHKDSIARQAAFRVDDYAIHSVAYRITYEKGEYIMFIGFEGFNKGGQLLAELEKGKTLRIKLDSDDEDVYLRVSLYGFTAATNRSAELLKAFHKYKGGKNDADYFNDSSYFDQPKTDAKYFQ